MATVDPRAFDWGSRIMQGMEQGRERRLQDVMLGQQQEDRARDQQERQMRMQNMQATQAQQQSENQYAQHQREAQTLFSASQALKRVPLERRRQTLETWAKSNPIIGGAIQHIPPETDLSDESLDEFGYGMSAALGGFQQGQAVQSVEMDENGNLFIIDRSGGIKQAINPQTGKPIVGRKPGAQVAGKRIVQGVDAQGNPAYQVVDLAAGEQPTIKPAPTKPQETTFDKEIDKQTAKRITDLQDTIPAVGDRLAALESVKAGFDQGFYSTGMENILVPDWLQSANNQDLITKINQEVLGKAEQMKGALSDKDVAFLKSSVLDINKGEAANKKILADVINVLKKAQARANSELGHYQAGGKTTTFKPGGAQLNQQQGPTVSNW